MNQSPPLTDKSVLLRQLEYRLSQTIEAHQQAAERNYAMGIATTATSIIGAFSLVFISAYPVQFLRLPEFQVLSVLLGFVCCAAAICQAITGPNENYLKHRYCAAKYDSLRVKFEASSCHADSNSLLTIFEEMADLSVHSVFLAESDRPNLSRAAVERALGENRGHNAQNRWWHIGS